MTSQIKANPFLFLLYDLRQIIMKVRKWDFLCQLLAEENYFPQDWKLVESHIPDVENQFLSTMILKINWSRVLANIDFFLYIEEAGNEKYPWGLQSIVIFKIGQNWFIIKYHRRNYECQNVSGMVFYNVNVLKYSSENIEFGPY